MAQMDALVGCHIYSLQIAPNLKGHDLAAIVAKIVHPHGGGDPIAELKSDAERANRLSAGDGNLSGDALDLYYAATNPQFRNRLEHIQTDRMGGLLIATTSSNIVNFPIVPFPSFHPSRVAHKVNA